jgi:hypothetical protein
VLSGRHEPEPAVVAGLAQQSHKRFVAGVGGAEYGVHERRPEALPLMVRVHAKRPETNDRTVLRSDARPAAYHVAHHLAADGGDERKPREPCGRSAKFFYECHLDRLRRPFGSLEGAGVDAADGNGVPRRFPANQHDEQVRSQEEPVRTPRPDGYQKPSVQQLATMGVQIVFRQVPTLGR